MADGKWPISRPRHRACAYGIRRRPATGRRSRHHWTDIRIIRASGGRIRQSRGSARVYAFPADPARWRGWSRGPARSNASGAYRVRSLLSGDYLVVAISEQDSKEITGAEWARLNPYERLATIAERVSLLESDRRVLDLRVTPIPEEWKR